MHTSIFLRLLVWGFCAYYIYYIAAPNALHLYKLLPDLWNISCGRTWLSRLSSIPFVAPGGRFLETACCVGSDCLAVARMPHESARVRVARSVDQYIDYWCDNTYYSWLTFGKSEVCHLTLAHGTWELDISRAFVPTLHGLAMLFLFSYAMRHAIARKTFAIEVTGPAQEQQQVRSPIEIMGVRDSKVSGEVAQDLKKLLQDTKVEQKHPDENLSLPGPDAHSDKLEAYMESLPQITAESIPKRVGSRPRRA